jgi:hypothetical protein
MKRKIVIGSILATLILLSQLVIVSPVVANEEDDIRIELSNEDKTRLENAIASFEGTELYNDLMEIYRLNLIENENENDELKITAIGEMVQAIGNFVQSADETLLSGLTMSINEIIEITMSFAIYGVAFIPIEMLILIYEDFYDLMMYYSECWQEQEFYAAVTLSIFLPDLYELLVQLELLKDYSVDRPDTPEEKKQYLKEIFREAAGYTFEALILMSGGCFGMYYLYPKLGYLTRMAGDLALIFGSASELVKDTKIKMEHFRNIFIDVPKAFVDLVDPWDGGIIVDFFSLLAELVEAKEHAEAWYYELYYNGTELFFDVGIFIGSLLDLITYWNREDVQPWLRPIEVVVHADIEHDEIVNVSFKDELQTDTSFIDGYLYSDETSIYYQTNITSNPAGQHTIVVLAEKDGEIKEVSTKGFSGGVVKVEPSFEKPKTPTKNRFMNFKSKISNLIETFHSMLLNVFALLRDTQVGHLSL